MSLLHPEEQRECKRCEHRWYAERWTKMQSGKPILASGFTKAQQANTMQTVHEQRLSKYDRWARCPECGSKKVRTVR